MGEPMYGPHPERRQVAMVDGDGNLDAYTGSGCVASAGHRVGDGRVALANVVTGPAVWESMVDRYERTEGPLAYRLLAALRAGEDEGGDFRGRRSTALLIVRNHRTGRPWRDHVADLRVDDDPDAMTKLGELIDRSSRYQRVVEAFELAFNGAPRKRPSRLDRARLHAADDEPDLVMWRAIVFALAGGASDGHASCFGACAAGSRAVPSRSRPTVRAGTPACSRGL